MMNVNENNEITTLDAPALQGGAQTIEPAGASFKEEFEKLLDKDNTGDIQIELVSADFLQLPAIDFETRTIETDKIENADAMFFLNIANTGEGANLQLNNETSVIDASNYKTMEISKTLGDMMLKASESNKALRLDFDNQVTVVLKVSKEGKIDASFFPQSREVETYLKNNIDYLKVRFDEQNIAYSNISYRPYKQNKGKEKNNE